MSDHPEIFRSGTTWVRADFHMHTNADKEFKYVGDPKHYVSNYVAALKKAKVRVAVITNHNKFDLVEFKAIAKAALKEEIYLLPGVELSVKDGANGIHTLVVFSPEWIKNPESKNYIQNFLEVTFSGIANFENENGRSNHDLNDTIRKLDEYEKDYFLVFAHVEAGSGLWSELAGGRLGELARHLPFQERCLGFQKVKTRDLREKIVKHLNGFYPAEVEGCDCKCIEDIGKGKQCFLKLGAFTFEAVKFALLDYKHRVASSIVEPNHSRINRVVFDGGRLGGTTINFSPELNTLIGIRGSGKSSAIESIRYALGIEVCDITDRDGYKRGSVKHALGSGGKATVFVTDQHGTEFEIRRIHDQQPDVYCDGELRQGISICETLLHKPIYFGQKDLSSKEAGFESELVEKLVGDDLKGIRQQIAEKADAIAETVRKLKKLSNVSQREKELIAKKLNAVHKLEVFKTYKVEEKLKKQVDFNNDVRFVRKATGFSERLLSSLGEVIAEFEDELEEIRKYESVQNSKFFKGFLDTFEGLCSTFEQVVSSKEEIAVVAAKLISKASEFKELRDSLKEEFAEVARRVSEDLKIQGANAIEPEDVVLLRDTIRQCDEDLNTVTKKKEMREGIQVNLRRQLTEIKELWHEEFTLIKKGLERINSAETALTIEVGFQDDKEAFLKFLKDAFKGSKLRESTLQCLVDDFVNCAEIYRKPQTVKKALGTSASKFKEWFQDDLASFLTWQVPNKIVIKYHGKHLKNHSLGQRASALILFVLSQRDSDIVIIDQPEDDLDNQTIYEDVIKLIRDLKPTTQFIFATHNPNIPVLGDCEQIISFKCDDKISCCLGSIDCPTQQKSVVTIMEGGREAFERRRDIYHVWANSVLKGV